MQNYTDTRTNFIKEILRKQIYQTYFYINKGKRVKNHKIEAEKRSSW